MTTSDKISLASAVATFLGVFVAFIALYLQFRKMNQQLQLQQFADYTKRYQDIVYRFPENINEAGFNYENLSADEFRLVMRNMRSYFDLSFEEWHLNRNGYLNRDSWTVWRGGMKTAMSKAAFQQAWQRIRKDTAFGDEFERFIDSLADA